MPKLVRTITYTGPQAWLDMCVDNGFVALKQELGNDGKSITSQWRDVRAQRRAEQINDQKRRDWYTNPGKDGKRQLTPRGVHTLDAPDRLREALELITEYREQHDSCNNYFLGRTDLGAKDTRCAICRAVDELENKHA